MNAPATAPWLMADLHVHVARALGRPVKIAASARLTVRGIIEESSTRKGLDAAAIVDAQSPPVLQELEALVEAGELMALPGGGLEWQAGGGGPSAPGGQAARPGRRHLVLILASEVEADEPRLGPVHHLVYLPDLETARAFSTYLARYVTNVALSSQRVRLTGEDLARWIGPAGGFLVPAHVFTPHKGFFGQGGEDLGQAFSDRALESVPAVELGLSSDTALADLVGSLAPFTYLSNSDAHSPETIAREHNAFALGGEPPPAGEASAPAQADESGPLDFRALAQAIRGGRIAANYGLDPRLGKYHRAFCPRCGFTSSGDVPAGSTCPACGKVGLVGGVLDRILALAGDSGGPEAQARPRPPYVHVVPLRYVPGVGPVALGKLLAVFGTEMEILHRAPREELAGVVGSRLADLICAARGGTEDLDISPGAGGRYGRVRPGSAPPPA